MYSSEVISKLRDFEHRLDKSIVKRCETLPTTNVGRIVIFDNNVYFWNGTEYEKIVTASDGFVSITTVNTFADLPPVNLNSGKFYWVISSTGTWWLPGNLGGTYRSKGMYFSNGITWETVPVPYQATQAEVNTGTEEYKFITPLTLKESTQWNTKVDVVSGKQLSTEDYTTTEKNKVASIDGLLDNKRNLYTWEYLVSNWSLEPTLNTAIAGGSVYDYLLGSTTRYRFVPTTYNPTQDEFYSNFNGVTLTGLITSRG